MQEFSSISVSSYEAGSLAERLTAQSRDGWDVVAIVPTGSTVTAYLCREASGDAPAEQAAEAPAAEPMMAADPAPAVVDSVPEPEPAPAESSWSALAEQAAEAEAPAPAEPEVPEIRLPETAAPAVAAADPVSEPGGWAVAPESASTSAPATSDPTIGLGNSAGASSIAEAAQEVAQAEPVQQAAQAEPVQQAAQQTSQATQAASAAAAPAGWYADPSSRYELRYWDGTQWTEHVSRGGQQFTDPPVA